MKMYKKTNCSTGLQLHTGKQWKTTRCAHTRCSIYVHCLLFLEVVMVEENFRETFGEAQTGVVLWYLLCCPKCLRTLSVRVLGWLQKPYKIVALARKKSFMFPSKALKTCGLAQTQCDTVHLCALNYGGIGSGINPTQNHGSWGGSLWRFLRICIYHLLRTKKQNLSTNVFISVYACYPHLCTSANYGM